MDLITVLIGIVVIVIGIGAYIWQLSNVFFTRNQWFSPTNKTVLITGCDSGIGLQLAQHFYQKGCIVFATVLDINAKGSKQLQQLTSDDQRLHLIQMDVTNDCEVNKAFEQIDEYLRQNQFEGLYCLINNAGICVMSEFDWLTWQHIHQQIDVNVLGTIRVTKKFLPLIIQSKGRVVNVSSVNGNCAYPGLSIYSATKFAIEGLSDSLRLELSKFNVKVVVVRPGDYARLTDIMSAHQSRVTDMWHSMDDNKRQLYGNYFHEYQRSVLKNSGLTSPTSFQSSTLFNDFEEAVLAVDPRLYITSASLAFRLFFLFMSFVPIVLKDKLFSTITSNMVKYDVKSEPKESRNQ